MTIEQEVVAGQDAGETPRLEVTDLVKVFPVRQSAGLRVQRALVQAVSGVSFSIAGGQTLGLVGESGSGKSTVGRCILQLIEPSAGSVRYDGQELVGMSRRAMQPLRREMQMVFQDPYASLDPRLTVGSAIKEPLQIHGIKGDHRAKVAELLELVGLAPDHAKRFPHEFSGGQRQRIGIARALALDPRLIVLDEPVSALDVSIQAGVVNLLQDLQRRLGLSFLFIAHDLSVVRHISQYVAVMYLGKIMEIGPAETLYTAATHPVHPGTAVGRARARSGDRTEPGTGRAHRRHPEPDRPAFRLPVPHPLPEGPARAAPSRSPSSSITASGIPSPATTPSACRRRWRRRRSTSQRVR